MPDALDAPMEELLTAFVDMERKVRAALVAATRACKAFTLAHHQIRAAIDTRDVNHRRAFLRMLGAEKTTLAPRLVRSFMDGREIVAKIDALQRMLADLLDKLRMGRRTA